MTNHNTLSVFSNKFKAKVSFRFRFRLVMEEVGVPGPSRDFREVSSSSCFVSDIGYKKIDFDRDSLPRNCDNCYLDQFQLLCYFGVDPFQFFS